MKRRVVACIPFSTQGQGKSGLGIEAQHKAIADFATRDNFEVVAKHVEVETGKRSDALEHRPVLVAARAEARKIKRAVTC